jgi:hypothetical protein
VNRGRSMCGQRLTSGGYAHDATRLIQAVTQPWIPYVALMLSACGPCHDERIAKLSNAEVVVAGKAGGGIAQGPVPAEGEPIALRIPPASRCMSSAELLARLGPACSHESENKAPSESASDPGFGRPPPTGEVRWYCDKTMDVRVVFEPCDTNGDGKLDGVSPVEIAVATHAH